MSLTKQEETKLAMDIIENNGGDINSPNKDNPDEIIAISLFRKDLFLKEFEEQCDKEEENGVTKIETPAGTINLDYKQMERALNVYVTKQLLSLKKQSKDMSVETAQKASKYFKYVDSAFLGQQTMDAINLYCSIFESSMMSEPSNRPAGDILIKGTRNFTANRCISGYIQSVPNADGLQSLEKILEDLHEKWYLEHIQKLKTEDQHTTRKKYLKDPNMRFITTNILDIDGTLLQSDMNLLNEELIKTIVEHKHDDMAICTRGEPRSQYDLILRYCQNELNKNPQNESVAKFEELIRTGKIKIYSKYDLIDKPDICEAGSITDDEMHEMLHIKTISDSTVLPYRSNPKLDEELQQLYEQVPSKRKITMAQYEEEKFVSDRMAYFENEDMKFITTNFVSIDAFLDKGELNKAMIHSFLTHRDDYAIMYKSKVNLTQINLYIDMGLEENPQDKTLLQFKQILESGEKTYRLTKLLGPNVCLTGRILVPPYEWENIGLKTLCELSYVGFSDQPSLAPALQEKLDKVPAHKKMSAAQYMKSKDEATTQQQNTPSQNNISRD